MPSYGWGSTTKCNNVLRAAAAQRSATVPPPRNGRTHAKAPDDAVKLPGKLQYALIDNIKLQSVQDERW